MMLKNNKLFYIILTIGLLAVVTGGIIYSFQHKQNTNTKSDTQTKAVNPESQQATSASSPTSSLTPATDTSEPTFRIASRDDLTIYTDTKFGFTIGIPKLVNVNSCGDKNAQGLYEIHGQNELIPTAVFDSETTAYIAPKYFYRGDGGSLGADNIIRYSSCEKVSVTAQLLDSLNSIKKYIIGASSAAANGLSDYYRYPQGIKIFISAANSDQSISSFLKKTYGNDCSLGAKTAVTGHSDTFDIAMANQPGDAGTDINGKIVDCPSKIIRTRYSQTKALLATWYQGDGDVFTSGENTAANPAVLYDSTMWDTLTFQ